MENPKRIELSLDYGFGQEIMVSGMDNHKAHRIHGVYFGYGKYHPAEAQWALADFRKTFTIRGACCLTYLRDTAALDRMLLTAQCVTVIPEEVDKQWWAISRGGNTSSHSLAQVIHEFSKGVPDYICINDQKAVWRSAKDFWQRRNNFLAAQEKQNKTTGTAVN